jgi:FkbM family methyltransferase
VPIQQLQVDLSGVSDVLDTTGMALDIQLPNGVRPRSSEPADISDLDTTTALVILAGPNATLHGGRAELDGLLRHLPAGGQAVLLLGWPAEDLPGHWVLDVLLERTCQIAQVVRPEFSTVSGLETALVVKRLAEPPDGLAAANVVAVAESGIAGLKQAVVVMNSRLSQVTEETRRLTTSTPFRAGQALAAAARSPLRGAITAPRDLGRLWRARRSALARQKVARRGDAMAVPLALPSSGSGAGRPSLLTLTAPANLVVPRYLAADGLAGYEPSALACFLAASDVADPGAIYDIGANIGIYAALAAAMTDRPVYAFEPYPLLVDVARRFSDDNKLGYTTESIALGAENGSATLYLSDRSDSSNSLNAGFRASSQQIEVPVETLDSYVDRTGATPSVLKIDTETTEPNVLAGATATIAKHRPWILCEVLSGRVESDLEQVLAPLGYRWYAITDEVPYREAVRIVGDSSYENLMWLFAPERPTGVFWQAVRQRREALKWCTPQRGRELQGRT